jgi:hypothetical protein
VFRLVSYNIGPRLQSCIFLRLDKVVVNRAQHDRIQNNQSDDSVMKPLLFIHPNAEFAHSTVISQLVQCQFRVVESYPAVFEYNLGHGCVVVQ